ncbi:MAG: hypothetical protein LBC70_08370, partial [Chitinispirillales bacterium]|nr:hypothetical protein [Chitinispirillales bacterium]
MTANKAQYLLSIADIDSRFFEVTKFSGEDAISSLYWFDIEFRMSAAAKAVKAPPPDAAILDKACRFDIERNG